MGLTGFQRARREAAAKLAKTKSEIKVDPVAAIEAARKIRATKAKELEERIAEMNEKLEAGEYKDETRAKQRIKKLEKELGGNDE